MESKKQKRIRSNLISYTNQQIKLCKSKNLKILINSLSLEQLEKKNMLCEEFIIIEKPLIFENIDNNRSIIENIYINNSSFISNIVIYPLSSRTISSNMRKNINIIFDNNLSNNIEDNKNENIINKKANKISCSQVKNNFGPPYLIKRELGERKLRMSKNEINFHITNCFSKDKLDNQKDNNENNNDFNICKISKQLSSETIATEISRIIKICHNDKSINSSILSRSNSILEETEDIKKAKLYAKKLQYYCLTLKYKYPNKQNIIKLKKVKNELNENNFDVVKNKMNYNKDKINFEKIEDKKYYRKIKSRKFIIKDKIKNFIKKYSAKIKDKNHDMSDENLIIIRPNKKMKSDKNIKNKFQRNSFVFSEDNYNNNTEQSTNAQCKPQENESRNKANQYFIKIKKKRKIKITEKEESKAQNKMRVSEKNDISPTKTKKKENIQNLFLKKIRNKITDNNNKNETKRTKKCKKESPPNNNKKKRISIDIRMTEVSNTLERVFLNTKNLSTTDEISIPKTSDKIIKNDNKENEQENHMKKKIKKKKNLNLRGSKISLKKERAINKTKTEFNKNKRKSFNLSKNLNGKKRKLSLLEEVEKITNKTNDIIQRKINENPKKITFKLDDDYIIQNKNKYENDINDDINIIDEYLYKKKHKRSKNTQK